MLLPFLFLCALPILPLSADALWGDAAIAHRIYPSTGQSSPPRPAGKGSASLPFSTADRTGRHGADGIPSRPGPRDQERERAREILLRRVDDAWQAEEEEDAIPSPAGLPPPEGRLQSLVLPKISLRDVPLAEAVEAIGASVEAAAGEGEGFNLLLLDGPEEERRVTLHLAHATLSRALQLLARAVDLDWEIDGDTVVLSSAARNRLRTKIFPISRATVLRLTNLRGRDGDGKDQIAREERLLREFLQNAGVDFHGTAGSGLAFDGSALVIAQNGRNLERVENILRRYAGSRQVEIEAKFIEVQQGALEELQLRLSLAGGHGGLESGDTLRSLVQAFSPRGSATADGSIVLDSWPTGGSRIDRIPIPNRVPQFPNAANLGQLDQPLVNVLSGAQTGLLLRALEQQSGSDLMSAPRLTVLPGKTAEIIVAQEFRYPEAYDEIQSSVGSGSSLNASTSAGVTITAGTPRNFQTRNVGVEMAVTPTVEDDGHISLRLEPSVTEFEGFVEYGGVSVAVSGGATVTVPSGFFQPIFSTRRIRTEVTIDDGATVVMGGLTREEVKEVRDKVPILGDIPLLGKFFRSKGTSSQKRNLLIFVTAKLIPLDPAR